MATVSLTKTPLAELATDALVVGVECGPEGPVLAAGAAGVDAAFDGQLADMLARLGATGKVAETTKLATLGSIRAPVLVATGLGDEPATAGSGAGQPRAASPDRLAALREAAGAAARALAGTEHVAAALPMSSSEAVRAVAEGLLLGNYVFDKFRGPGSDHRKRPVGEFALAVVDGRIGRAALGHARAVSRAVALCRDLVNTPPGDLHPAELASAAVVACAPYDLSVQVLDEAALREGGYGGILGVGQGSANPPRLVRIGYTHPRARRRVALVGKGITFDSGGLSLKTSAGMEWMKSDMGGAAAVLAAMTAIGELRPRVHVTGWMPTAENMPGGAAIRPSDVLRMYAGTTVEVLNTDAEGRLVLADAIARACEESPDVLLDAATLTGAQLVALGTRTFAVMANDDELRRTVLAAAERSGESAWPMPLPPYLRGGLDSKVADLRNVGMSRDAGMLTAGTFLSEFVAEGVRWAHLDIAGPAFNQGGPWGHTPPGGTGAAVATFVDYVTSLS